MLSVVCSEMCANLIIFFLFLSQAYQDGSLQKLLGDNQITEPYEYDLIIIGGGSGGLACSKV